MSSSTTFESVSLISGADVLALPVRTVAEALPYYTDILGFAPASTKENTAVLERDGVRIGLAVTDEDPEQVSVYFSVGDVEALHTELSGKGAAPSALQNSEYGGRPYRIFFAKEPSGVCFCFGTPIAK